MTDFNTFYNSRDLPLVHVDGSDGVFTTELLSACVGHVHVTKISIWRVYTNSNGDSLNNIRQYNQQNLLYMRVLNDAVWPHICGNLYHN